jgi:hypothetical protein
MNKGRLIFTQAVDILHREEFDRCIARYPMPRVSRSFSARDQFLAMAFAQMTFRESLRDIEACLSGCPHLYGMGIRGNVTRTNLAYANEHRDWQIYADVAQVLIRKARRLYADDRTELDVDEIVYALDSTTINLCLAMFPWATFRENKGAIKMHTQIDLRGPIPVFISITKARTHDVHFLDEVAFEPGSIYVIDRAYVDFNRLYRMHTAGAFFVTRAKANMRFYVCESRPVDRSTGLRCDQIIRLSGPRGKKTYPEKLRRIRFIDPDTGKSLVFLTNHFTLPALTIAAIYKSRWRIELFFKWIKQNLRIKAFYGTSVNAVKTQIWIAICVYLLVACLKKVHRIDESLSRILQILSVNVFQKVPVYQLLGEFETRTCDSSLPKQLTFNDF